MAFLQKVSFCKITSKNTGLFSACRRKKIVFAVASFINFSGNPEKNILLNLKSFLVIFLLFSYCSTTEKKESNNSVTEAKNVLRELAGSDPSKDSKNSRKLQGIFSEDSSLFNNLELRSLATELFSNKDKETKVCKVSIVEPNTEKTYVMNGFIEPLKLVSGCGELGNIPILLRSEGAVRFKSKRSNQDNSVRIDTLTNGQAEFDINALSMKPDENIIVIQSASRYDSATIDIIKKLGVEVMSGYVQFNPSSYQIQKTPTAYSRDYDQLGDKLFNPDKLYTLKSKNMNIAIAPNGVFTMGGEDNGKQFDLLYGHPNGAYADSHGTSYTTIKIGNKNYKFGSLDNLSVKSSSPEEVVVEGKVPGMDIFVQQVFQKNISRTNVFQLGYRIFNKSKTDIEGGVRILLDTWAGDNDGVPFAIPGITGKEQSIYEEEISFSSTLSPIWETVDVNQKGTVFIRNTMIGSGLTPPDNVIFSSWPGAYESEWDYFPERGRSVTGDSAILSYWNPKKIKPGSVFSISTEYSYVKKENKIAIELLDSEKGTALFSIDKQPSTANKVQYKLDISQGKVITDSGSNLIEYNLKEGEGLTRVVPITLMSTGKVVVTVTETIGSKSNKSEFNFELTGKGSTPSVWSSKKIPVSYTDEKSGLKLKGIFINQDSGKEVASTILKEVSSNNGKFFYTGEIDIKGYEGRGVVQIEEIEDKPKLTFEELPPPPAMGLTGVENYNLLDNSFTLIGKIIGEFNGKYEIELLKNTKPELNQILYVIDPQKRVIGKIKIKEISSEKAFASFQESLLDITPGMDSGVREKK